MAAVVQVFKDNAIAIRWLETAQKEAEKRAEVEKRKAINNLADTFESSVKEVVNGMRSAATEMEATTQSMSAISEETNRQAMSVTAAAEQASVNVQTVLAAAEELSLLDCRNRSPGLPGGKDLVSYHDSGRVYQ